MSRKRGFAVTVRTFIECEPTADAMVEASRKCTAIEEFLRSKGFDPISIQSSYGSKGAAAKGSADANGQVAEATNEVVEPLPVPAPEPSLDIPAELDRRPRPGQH